MVRALLAGTKTQTRRIVKQFLSAQEFVERGGEWFACGDRPTNYGGEVQMNDWREPVRCPYGQPGDQLWVREEHYRFGHWVSIPGVKTKTGRMKWRFVPDAAEILYEPPPAFRKGRHHKDPATPAWHKRLARFMPRAASRTQLEVSEIRVERLQDINEADCRAEGCPGGHGSIIDFPYSATPREHYRHVWNGIKGAGSWDLNPWVWAVSFRKINKEIQ
jgi:hypothetical protein